MPAQEVLFVFNWAQIHNQSLALTVYRGPSGTLSIREKLQTELLASGMVFLTLWVDSLKRIKIWPMGWRPVPFNQNCATISSFASLSAHRSGSILYQPIRSFMHQSTQVGLESSFASEWMNQVPGVELLPIRVCSSSAWWSALSVSMRVMFTWSKLHTWDLHLSHWGWVCDIGAITPEPLCLSHLPWLRSCMS